MIESIGEYQIIEQLYESDRSLVYRCFQPGATPNKTVILKLLKGEYPTIKELVQFRNQYAISKNLELPGVVKPISLENYRNSLVLVMEDNGCVSLSDYVLGKRETSQVPNLNMSEFLNIAIAVAQALEGIHQHRIIHKDIKPQNIVINPETKQVKLIDFSISSLLPKESQEIINPNILEGALAYISPEQTGRMNRGIDYRSDFYSLGVTFYQLLTGVLPFQSNDAMELVHCHIARMPTAPIVINPAIGQVLNNIVMKLMAKTAEDRYQTAFGLRTDLERCLIGLAKGTIAPFELATTDICDRFIIPEKLYGRETEVETLLAAFDRVAGKDEEIEETTQSKIQNPKSKIELMLVAGASGIGKTAVVNEVDKPIVRSRGYFIKGKFDQFQRDIPFSAWVQAFQNLMRQLLTESVAAVEVWKAKLLEALGENSQVIIDVIPELELLIGKQPPVPELEGSGTQNRFNLLFEKFTRVFTTREHPLVIFLDDLQWADAASLKLMQLLMSNTSGGYLLLIGAYRDNEVFSGHPFMLTLGEIRKANAKINEIILVPLEQLSLNCLISETLSCPPEMAEPLTELVFAKTQGSPFFVTQFLKSLYEEGLIYFVYPASPAPQKGEWQFDITNVKAFSTSDDVVEFMAHQLQKLPENTQSVLKLAACIGNSFDLETLAIVYEKSQAETAADLWKALQEGFVIPQREDYKFFQGSGEVEVGEVPELSIAYNFLHDRVQQAAYYTIPDNTKQSTHLKLGQLLLSNTPSDLREEKIFDIVNHLNMGVELISPQLERDKLARLNLIAGRKAKAYTAYIAAVNYFIAGLELLMADSWQSYYNLTLALHEEVAEAAYLCGNFQQMKRFAEEVQNHAKTLLDKVKVSQIQILAYVAQNKQLKAVNTGQKILKLLGVDFPEKPNISDFKLEQDVITSSLTGKQISDLFHLQKMTDPNQLAAMQILFSITPAAYQATPELFPLISLKQVNLSIHNGNGPTSALAYANYGIIMCALVGDIESGYQFGQLALNLLEKLEAQLTKTRVNFVVNYFIRPVREHIRESLIPLRNNYQFALESGDLEHAAYSIQRFCYLSYFVGQELGFLDREMVTYSKALLEIKQESILRGHEISRQAVQNLMGKSQNPHQLSGAAYDEEKMLPIHLQANDITLIFQVYLHKIILCYIFGKFLQAVDNAKNAEHYLSGAIGSPLTVIFHFYDSLARLSVYPETLETSRNYLLEKVAVNQEKIKKWAHHAPENFMHKFYLVEAELHRVLGENFEAMEDYDRAITLAKENQYINEEALANELAAKFYLGLGREKIYSLYLTNAYYGYFRWGALAKVDDLEKRYSQLLAPIKASQTSTLNSSEKVRTTATDKITSSSTGSSDALDLATVISASQAISKEVNLQQLLCTLMRVALENAGASFGALILHNEGNLTIEATAVLEDLAKQLTQTQESQEPKIAVHLLPSLPVIEGEIPMSGLNYVARTQEILLINDATVETMLANDPYIIRQQPKSVLCIPILNQGKLIGILYLENNLAVKAFTTDRVEVLKIISYQAAISLENAQLYNKLDQKVKERTQELAQTLEELKATQQELIQSEKLAALGQLIAGIAHEINTPIGAIRASNSNIVSALNSSLKQLPQLLGQLPAHQQANFIALLDSLKNHNQTLSSREERQLRRKLRQELETYGLSDADTIADTLVPMGITADITPFLPLLQDSQRDFILEVANDLSSLLRNSDNITLAVERASKIVFALKSYVRQNSSGEMVRANITSGIDIVLTIYQNQLKQGIEVIKKYGEVPEILCYPEELNQVWTNLIHNAIQAMENRGKLEIKVFETGEEIVVQITDFGSGIPPEIKPRIFEPFFTTKPAGEGSGLGLDIVQKIVKLHQGRVEVESEPGQTTFSVFLPVK